MVRKPAVAHALLLVVAGFVHLAGTTGNAAPPKINNLSPLGVPRGVATELTFSGANLTGSPRLIAPVPFQIEPSSPPAKSDAANWKVRLTVAPGVAVGVYPIRIQTDDGISAPFLLPVGQLPPGRGEGRQQQLRAGTGAARAARGRRGPSGRQ